MPLYRVDLADIHKPPRLGQALHRLLGPVDGPVPIEDIAHQLDIENIRLDTFDGFEGMLLTDQRRRPGSILANTRHCKRRARFTIAHELGHFLMERHVLFSDDGFCCMQEDFKEARNANSHFRQENEANLFAIEVLAPVATVSSFLADDPDLRRAQRMREHLDLSLEASLRRIIDLPPHPLAAIWSINGKIRYAIETRAFPFLTVSRGQLLPKSYLAAAAVANGTRGFTEMDETHAQIWTSRPEVELSEQTRVEKSGHAVTLLWADLRDEVDEDDGGLAELGTPRFR
ncbi:ImmA/IrrE family metallo-endopeptidase [Arenibacterium halophilum]|uniref:ImmA/IrrE family metallo-endopeptidase n=1 Tax=Arenibacterium halophilum TaxID=2583821 RepID=A0ABY2X9M7_9RHOB|nr:ImmA/IrrE family metallo-endopeptidase [Arenibacterium halophilum]TMV13079.1 ImmA/IrrE family metallo-endopeptidase [Arenibacterium halophilum]